MSKSNNHLIITEDQLITNPPREVPVTVSEGQALFTAHYNATVQEIVFDPSYNNGTGYFDPLVQADLDLKPGHVARMYTGGTNRRRILIVGTQFGNVVIFDRYSEGENRSEASHIAVGNFPRAIRHIFSGSGLTTGRLSVDALYCILGSVRGKNIGHRLAEVFPSVA